MKVLIVGGGGREHALAWKFSQSPLLEKLYAAPGNAGIAQIAECLPIQADDIESLLKAAKEKSIDLTVVGPEAPLAKGIVDRFRAEGLKIFGPTKAASELESSKIFAKEVMKRAGVPTAEFRIFDKAGKAKHYLIESEPPFVIKADGLASGKGVVVADSYEEAVEAVTRFMEQRSLGESGSRILIEEKLVGEELSVLVLTDGENIIPLASAQDHKRLMDLDRGPNTGGMGAYSPCPFLSAEGFQQAIEKTVRPILLQLAKEGRPYQGILYAGLMLTKEGASVLEYNVRLGDPETQAVLPRLKSDLLPVLNEIAGGKLKTSSLEWEERASVNVVMAAAGYPEHPEKGSALKGLEQAGQPEGVYVFHAGTSKSSMGPFTVSGGRVLSVTALGDTLKAARDKAYEAVYQIQFEGAQFRRDIGQRALNTAASKS